MFQGAGRCQANVAHIKQSRPYSGLGFQIKVFELFLSCPLFARQQFQGAGLLLDRRDHHDAVGKGTASCRCRANVAHARQSQPDSGRRDHHDAAGKGVASCFKVQAAVE